MAKMLEILGLVLVAIMALGFMGLLQPTIEYRIITIVLGLCRGNTHDNHL